MSEYVLNFDGSCGPRNPGGKAAYGYVILKDGFPLHEGSGKLNGGPLYSNNYAEFYGLFKGLEYLKDIIEFSDKLFIRGDSQLTINVMRKRWRPKTDALYYEAYVLASQTLTRIRSQHIPVSLDWVPREYNRKADELSKYDRA